MSWWWQSACIGGLHSKSTALNLNALIKCVPLTIVLILQKYTVQLHKKCFEKPVTAEDELLEGNLAHRHFARTSMTSGKFYELNKSLWGILQSVITRIERFPLVVSPIVKLRVEGPALLLPEAPPGRRTFLEDADGKRPSQYTCKDHAFAALTVQINSF